MISNNEVSGIGTRNTGVLISGNRISGNYGSGIRIYSGQAHVIGNMIVGNEAGLGGGIYSRGDFIYMENNTISMNTATGSPYGTGGIRISQCDTVYLHNIIIWGNEAPNGSVQNMLVYDTYLTISFTNIEGGYDSIWVDSTSTIIWGPGNIDADPLFESGPICDYHLSMSSPCIDAGNPSVEYNDPEDPFNPGYALWPAMGYLRNDMGAFGGGAVDYWLSAGEEEEEQGPSPGRGLILTSFPNPFRASCVVSFQLEQPSRVNLSLYDLSGRLVEVLLEGHVPSGLHTEHIDGSGLSSGVYLIRLSTEDGPITRRCVVVR